MASLYDLKLWMLRDFSGKFTSPEKNVVRKIETVNVVPDEYQNGDVPTPPHLVTTKTQAEFWFYTDTNEYKIYAVEESNSTEGYLGGSFHSRKERPAEDWHRGNDLADGPLTEETWLRILRDVLSCELQDITSKDQDKGTVGLI